MNGKWIGLLLALGFMGTQLMAQNRSESTWADRLPYRSGDVVVISNVNGEVKVKGADIDEVLAKGEQTLHAKKSGGLELAQSEVQIVMRRRADTIFIFVDAPYLQSPMDPSKNRKNYGEWPKKYDFKIDFQVVVPTNAHVVAKTDNSGDVYMENIKGITKGININGDVEMVDVSTPVKAKTVNGNVEITLDRQPVESIDLKSVNGRLVVIGPENMDCEVSFKTRNGDLYTSYALSPISLSQQAERSRPNGGTRYKIDGATAYKIGAGGPKIQLNTLNGDIVVKAYNR
ncbi:DUF4097 family beta strand repeat-containing protein [Pontibacter sp. G13]|uniref:DUF4097 family beta strand repeat-containing protein n=1 Tax=Pontibacter sp. G13 TaxID=3074898 RepID=UPI00288BA575|nr:DUF4097 family beta strand repeat-containing protein [Pontibacter sp. G13]WNJ17292.1 DUF4097 family beta strand repeat-containing protein [Pontibacter sp. G13]